MAFNDPLDFIDTVNLDFLKPILRWPSKLFDGTVIRNQHEQALAARDNYLLTLIQAVKDHGGANISPLYPFVEEATLEPSQATCYDNTGAVFSGFTVDPTVLKLSNSFIGDLKLILSNQFRDPFLSSLTLNRAVDPNTGLVQIFVDLVINARFTVDQQIYPILSLTSKAFNDVQDNSAPSSRDNVAFVMTVLPVNNQQWLNSGVIRFNFIGSVQSTTPGSWSIGTYNNATVEGFSTLPTLAKIEFTFPAQATYLTELSYNLLGDLQNGIPFLTKVQNYPFSTNSTAGQLLAPYITDIEITAPAGPGIFIKRIRISGTSYIFVFAYNRYDNLGNYLGTVNIGVATIAQNGPTTVPITSLGSNAIAGIAPSWLDEVPTTNTTDNFGIGNLTVASYAGLATLFAQLLAEAVTVGSPSPIEVSPVAPVQIVGVYADPTMIEMVAYNSLLNTFAVDSQGVRVATFTQPPTLVQQGPNSQVSIGGVLVNRRTVYGTDPTMRDFYGIAATESLINNSKIPLEDQWYNTLTNSMSQYQIVQGKRQWRAL